MKKVIVAAFVSGLFLSAFVSKAKPSLYTGAYTAAVSDTDTTKKLYETAVSDTDTTKKLYETVVSDTDTTKKIMVTDMSAVEDSKTQIDPASLPESVKTTLASDEYKEWQVSNAYEIKGSSNYYEIELKKGDSKNTVKLDKDGKKI